MSRRRSHPCLAALGAACVLAGAACAQPGMQPIGSGGAVNQAPEQTKGVEVVERPGEQIPLDLQFINSEGKPVQLGDYFRDGKPVIMALVYYDCPIVCNIVMGKLTEAFSKIDFNIGDDYRVVFASIDPTEEPPLAASVKERLLGQYARSGAQIREGWGFLTAPGDETHVLAAALGWNYRPIAGGEFSHPVCIFVLTPEGKIARYVYGLDYDPATFRMALLEATDGKISESIGDQIRLFCFRYDPSTGKYSMVAMRVVQLGGIVSILAVGSMVGVMLVREKINRGRARTRASTEARSQGAAEREHTAAGSTT
ncbi:MAG: SCO family protein [Phycisphaerales bacterium]|nr:SCO family protein [Phycisphaerales bacterium]